MNAIREIIMMDLTNNKYTEMAEHNDLIEITVGSECFEDEEAERFADFAELLVILDKDWLFNKMIKEGIENPRDYLKNEYTSDDSYSWYEDAMREKKIVMVGFSGNRNPFRE